MYYPYYPLKKEDVNIKIEKIRPPKNAATEVIRTFSGFVAAFLIVVLCAFCLHAVEVELRGATNSAIAAPPAEKEIRNEIIDKNCSVKEILEKGYLKVTGLFKTGETNFFHKILGIKTAHAAAPHQSMKLIESAKNLEMAAGDRQLFVVGFKNTGTRAWKRDGAGFVSVYTYSPKYRDSVFKDESWHDSIQPAKLKSEIVNPGEIGFIEFFLKAPENPGDYTETFRLASEDTAWMVDGTFSISINVSDKPELKAVRLIQSHKKVTLKQGEVVEFSVGFKNIGRDDWAERIMAKKELQAAALGSPNDTDLFVDSSWADTLKAVVISGDVVKPGQIGFLNFKLKAPIKAGNYKLKLALVVNGEYVEGGELEIPATVTNERIAGVASGTTEVIPTTPLGPQPNMRVGLFYTTAANSEPVHVMTNGDYEVRNANLDLLTTLPPRTMASLTYDFSASVYSINVSGSIFTSAEHLRLIPRLPSTFEITSFENRPKWNRTLNDNVFRGTMEFRFSEQTDRLWVINDIPLEDYLRGLTETMSTDPIEYQKAIVVAARSYAYYHFANGGKHPKQHLTLNASSYDQVYRGYNSEIRLPNVVQAVNETKGMVVTYGGRAVVTPYFAKSNGRTKTWTQAWGGASKPWLPSRPCPYDAAKGRTLFGHGVGMSMYDARDRARDGFNFQEILDAYYTNIQVARIYQ